MISTGTHRGVRALLVVAVVCAIELTACGPGTKSPLPTPPGFRPLPGYTATCSGSITEECARTAAADIGHDVAWMEPPQSSKANGIASNHSVAFESLIVAEGALQAYSNPKVGTPVRLPNSTAYRVDHIRLGGNDARMVSDSDGSFHVMRVTWTHRGSRYSLGLGAYHPLEASTLIKYWHSLDYAS